MLAEKINKIYQLEGIAVPVLVGVSLAIKKQDFVAIMGPLGSGKSTLLNLIGCLDRPISGKMFIEDTDTSRLSDEELAM